MSNKYIGLDCETGGIGLNTSLLSIYFGVFDEDFNLTAELDLATIPDDGVYKVEPRALQINGIMLGERHNVRTYREAGTLVYRFLDGNTPRPLGRQQLTPIGHNVAFDIERVYTDLISRGSWERYVSYRPLDTQVVARFLQLQGKMPAELNCGLASLIDYFGIKIDGVAHTAKYDTLATVAVMKNLMYI